MKISYKGTTMEIQKTQDSTHFLCNGRIFHVAEVRILSEELSDDLHKWLLGLKTDEEISSSLYN